MHIKKSIAEYLKKHKEDDTKLEHFSKFLDEFFEKMDDEYTEVRDAFREELENELCEIDMDMVNAILDNLKTKEGIKPGIKWSIDDTTSVSKQYDVPSKLKSLGKECDPMIFYFAMNYVYIVHNSNNRTLNGYIDLAIDEYANKNICIHEMIKKLFKKI